VLSSATSCAGELWAGEAQGSHFSCAPPALMAMWVLAELEPHTDSNTGPFKGRLVFPVQWLHSRHANWQTWWYAGGMPAYPFKSSHTVQRHAGSQRASEHNINMMFSQSSAKPCQLYRAQMRNGLIKFHWDVVSAQTASANTTQTDNHRQVTTCKKADTSVLKGRIDTKN